MKTIIPSALLASLLFAGQTAIAAESSSLSVDRMSEYQMAAIDNDYQYRPYDRAASFEEEARPILSYDDFMDALRSLGAHGLYAPAYLERLRNIDANSGAAINRYLREVVADLRFGATRRDALTADQQMTLDNHLQALKGCSDAKMCFQDIAARHPQYEALQVSLDMYQSMEKNANLPMIAPGKILKGGESDERLPQIRRYLMLTGDLIERDHAANHDDMEGRVYDEAIRSAVMAFQRRHGLKQDGALGPNTRRAMNKPLADRIEQIKLSLERLRKLPEPDARHYVQVNIPNYTLTAYDGEAKALEMPVIVGMRSRQTPEFFNHINTIGLNPTWTPPKSILRRDLLPKFRNDPEYAIRGGYRIKDRYTGESLDPQMVDWHRVSASDVMVVQRSGQGNALGKVKFLLPNNHSIYLHDTAKPYLFKKEMRALSSGCIRLSEPQKFLDYVIKAQENPRFEKLHDYYQSSARKHVSLDRQVPVITTYFTAWVNPQGQVEFYNDVYRKDNKLQLALERETRQLAQR